MAAIQFWKNQIWDNPILNKGKSNHKGFFLKKKNVRRMIQTNHLIMASIQFWKIKFEIIQLWRKENPIQKKRFWKNVRRMIQTILLLVASIQFLKNQIWDNRILKFWDNPILKKGKSNQQKTFLKKCSLNDPKQSFTHGLNPIFEKSIFEIIQFWRKENPIKQKFLKNMFAEWSTTILYSWPQSNFRKITFWDNTILKQGKSNQTQKFLKKKNMFTAWSKNHLLMASIQFSKNQIWDNTILKNENPIKNNVFEKMFAEWSKNSFIHGFNPLFEKSHLRQYIFEARKNSNQKALFLRNVRRMIPNNIYSWPQSIFNFEIIQFWRKENQIKKVFLEKKSSQLIQTHPFIHGLDRFFFSKNHICDNPNLKERNIQSNTNAFEKHVHSLIQTDPLLMASIHFLEKQIYSWPQSNFGNIKFEIIQFWSKENQIQKRFLKNMFTVDPDKLFIHGHNPILDISNLR